MLWLLEEVFLGGFLSSPIGVSGLPSSSASDLGKGKKKTKRIYCCVILWVLGSPQPSLVLSTSQKLLGLFYRLGSEFLSSLSKLKKTITPHSNTFAWKIPWTEEPGRLQSMGSLELDTTVRLHFHFSLSCIGEGNGNPLQCSCLENPRDGRAWWAAVYGVTQSRTRLKRLSSGSSSSGSRRNREKYMYFILIWSWKSGGFP